MSDEQIGITEAEDVIYDFIRTYMTESWSPHIMIGWRQVRGVNVVETVASLAQDDGQDSNFCPNNARVDGGGYVTLPEGVGNNIEEALTHLALELQNWRQTHKLHRAIEERR